VIIAGRRQPPLRRFPQFRDRIRKLGQMRLGEGAALLKLQAILKRCEAASRKLNDLLHNSAKKLSDQG